MKLQELIDQTELDMSVFHIKAFFLGVLCADKPMPFSKVMDEMFSENPEQSKVFESELKILWENLQQNKPAELRNIFPASEDLKDYLEKAKEQLDYFLTAMSLSGTHAEACKNADQAELIDELEDTVMDLEDYVTEDKPEVEEGEELKEALQESWSEYLSTLKQ